MISYAVHQPPDPMMPLFRLLFRRPGPGQTFRAALLLGMLALAALPLRTAPAQILSADAGVLVTPNLTDPVLEIYAAAAPVAKVRPYLIASWTVGELKPVLITQVALPTFSRGRVWNSIDAGATWFPFRDYRPVPSVSTYLGVRLPLPRTHAFTLFAVQPFQQEWSLIAGVAYTFLYRR